MADDLSRPWHGADNPFEALYSWTRDRMAALESRLPPLSPPAAITPEVQVATDAPPVSTEPDQTPAA